MTTTVLRFVGAAAVGAMLTLCGIIAWNSREPSDEKRNEADRYVTDAFNCLVFAEGDRQNRVFADLMHAAELDPQGTLDHLRTLGECAEFDHTYPLPEITKPLDCRAEDIVSHQEVQ